MVIAMGFANWSQTSVGAKGFLCLVLMFFYGTGVSKCDLGYKKNSNKTDKRHGLGFLSLGRRNFITDKAEKYRNNLVLTRIRNAQKLNATCIDDSDAVFYKSIHLNSKHWIIHLQAGGSCVSLDDCLERSNGPLGSSIHMDYAFTGEYTLSNDPKVNPTFHSWNKVFIPYCSGDVFVGRKPKHKHPFKMPMLGHFIVVAVIKQLIQDYRINRKGVKILFGGTSAGGLGVIANVDHVKNLTHPAEVKAYNDGGWFTLYPNFGEDFFSPELPQFFKFLTYIFDHYWDGFVDETCRDQMPKAAACLYGELASKHISTPLFVMVARWDSYQLTRLVAVNFKSISLPPKKNKERKYLAKFGNNTYRSLTTLSLRPKCGVFSPACHCHTFLTSCFEGSTSCQYPPTHRYSIKGQTAYGALSEWFTTNGKRGTYIEKPSQVPSCNPTCCSSLCHKCMLEKKVSSTPRGNPKIVAVKPKIQPPARKKKTFYLYYSNSEWRFSGLFASIYVFLGILIQILVTR